MSTILMSGVRVMLLAAVLVLSCCKKEGAVVVPVKPAAPQATFKTYYVSPAGSDDNAGLSSQAPLKTLNKAAGLTLPGDVVLLMDGVYPAAGRAALDVTRSGMEGKYITYKPSPGASPKIQTSGSVYDAVRIRASYIKLEGIEVIGHNADINLADAKAAQADAYAKIADVPRYGLYNTNGINVGIIPSVFKTGGVAAVPHHVEIRNCNVHDLSAAGIVVQTADWVTIEDNTVYNTCWFNMYGSSGISTKNTVDVDANVTDYKFKILRNKCYNNYSLVNYLYAPAPQLSDGNGIIIDTNKPTVLQNVDFPKYNGRTLIANNLVYLNGGGGIRTIEADKVDIINNTTYKNGQTQDAKNNYANISGGYGSSNVRILGNIIYAKPGGRCTSIGPLATNVTFNYNVLYYTTTVVSDYPVATAVVGHTLGSHDKDKTDPKFVNESAFNFLLQLSSPAINAGTPPSVYDYIANIGPDLAKSIRIKNGVIDCGAYEIN